MLDPSEAVVPSLVDQCILAIKSRDQLNTIKQFEAIRERMFQLFDTEKQKQFLDEVQLRYNNGQLHKHIHYLDGQLHGEYRVWARNGTEVSRANYHCGKQHGLHTIWRNTGEFWSTCNYEDGKVTGAQYVSAEIQGKNYRRVYENGKCTRETIE